MMREDDVLALVVSSARSVSGAATLNAVPGISQIFCKRSIVLRRSRSTRTPEYTSRLPGAVFARLLAYSIRCSQAKKDCDERNEEGNDIAKKRAHSLKHFHQTSLELVTLTEYSREKVTTYKSSVDFARAMAANLEQLAPTLLAYVGVTSKGELELSTHLYVAKQHAQDMLLCRDCGSFFNGMRGLRDHQQCYHRTTYEYAKASD